MMQASLEWVKKIPLTETQKGIFFDCQVGDPRAYQLWVTFSIEGIEEAYFKSALKLLITEQEVLRSSIRILDNFPMMLIHKKVDCPFFLHDFSLNVENQKEQVSAFLDHQLQETFELEKAPLFQVHLLKLKPKTYLLLVGIHHIIADGLSINLMMKRWVKLYSQLDQKQPIILKKETGFSTFSQKESHDLQSTRYEKQKTYWLNQLKGIEPTPLQGDYLTKKIRGVGREMRFEVPKPWVHAIEEICKTQGVSEFMFFLAVFSVLLSYYTNQKDILITSPFSYKPGIKLENTMGCFIRLLPLNLTIDNKKTFLEILGDVSKTLIDAYKNVQYPVNTLVRDQLALPTHIASQLFDINYVYDIDEVITQDQVVAKMLDQDKITFPGKLMVILNKTPEHHKVKFQYKPELFSKETIELLGRRYLTLLGKVINNLSAKLESIDLMLEGEKEQILNQFNCSHYFDYPPRTVIDVFIEKTTKYPSRIALIEGDKTLTYEEVREQVDQLATYLLSVGAKVNECIGIALPRSIDLILATLAVLRVGCTYVPIDPAYPKKRSQFIIKDAHISLLLTSSDTAFEADETLKLIYIEKIRQKELNESKNNQPQFCETDPQRLAYIAYTSGSTGQPKGVMIKNQGVVNTLMDLERRFPVEAGDVFLFKTAYTFDISVTELFGWFIGNGSLFVLEPGGEKNLALIIDEIERRKITHINFAPSVFRLFLERLEIDQTQSKLKTLKWLFLGGESIAVDILEKWRTLNLDSIRLENLYGPTECTLWATHYPIREFSTQKAAVPIGQPLNHTRCYIVGSNHELQPIGIPGELCLSGAGLAKGYLNLETTTNNKFKPNPFFDEKKDPPHYRFIYHTGDLARFLPDGQLEFLGRIDFQVKIRGMRLELEEIEQAINPYEGVIQSVVVPKKVAGKSDVLCAYYHSETEIAQEKLRAYLSQVLPDFMIPSFFVHKQTLPLLPSGKVNRKLLMLDETPGLNAHANKPSALPKTDLERKLAAICRKILNLNEIGLDDNFFEIGGHSLSLIQFNSHLKSDLNLDVPIKRHFQYPTLRSLAQHLSQDKKEKITTKTKPFERKKSPKRCDIAIIGLSINVPGADNIKTFWENLKAGRETLYFYDDKELLDYGISPDTIKANNYVKANGRIEGVHEFDTNFFDYTPSDIHLMSPQFRLLHKGLWEAFEDAGCFPENYPGLMGLFLGGSDEFDWYKKHLFPDNFSDKYQAFTLSSNHFLATRLAYYFDIKGPVFTSMTACSTTLMTTHLACQSLILGECDVAVAGGITVELPNETGYFYEPGLMFSEDGHCRPFDASASGTVFSNGMGMAVLKRLDDALRDGDSIYAVIKGTAINNDGRQKMGFTAPSVEGQAQAIRQAYQNAGVDPESISYVEAHGTGTKMGDPIEVDSLTHAFATNKRQFCTLGSVKGNVGHTDTAAGIVSLAKVALSLKNGYLPGTVNYQKPNPQVHFEKTPFVVKPTGEKWVRSIDDPSTPLRAGINSFGVGGTNAHAVLEEAPLLKPTAPMLNTNLLIFSARTPTALDNTIKKVLAYLDQTPDINLSDVAWTLQIGRKEWEYRKFLVVDEALIKRPKIDWVKPMLKMAVKKANPIKKPVYFMFSGQGSQYLNMARELYDSKEDGFSLIFKQHLEHVFSYLSKNDQTIFWDVLYGDDPQKIHQTAFSQLTLFALGYALAKTLIHIGIQPDAMLGHSIGEITAATIAGVFDVKTAVAIVKKRGELMQAQEKGAMLAVMQDAGTVRQALNKAEGIWLALDNTSNACVVAGKQEAISQFAKEAQKKSWATLPLKTSHAFHTPMMQNAADAFQAYLKQYDMQSPKIPMISNLTGDWISDEDAKSPAYWSLHILNTVHFSQGLSKLLSEEKGGVFLELGPGNTLCLLAMQHDKRQSDHHFINWVRHPKELVNDVSYVQQKIGEVWSLGLAINWRVLKGEPTRRKLSLPTYAFDKISFPVDVRVASQHATSSDLPQTTFSNRPQTVSLSVDKAVHEAYQQVLGFDEIDNEVNFFALGGDSIKAVSLIRMMSQALNANVDIQLIFQYPTPAQLIAYLKENLNIQESSHETIAPSPPQEAYPLSSAQNRIYTLYLLDKSNTAYNLPSATLIKGKIDPLKFEQALQKLVERHESLRTTFHIRQGQPVQTIHKGVHLPFRYYSQSLPDRPSIDRQIERFIQPFDLQEGPLLRAELIKMSDDHHLFLFDIHHIVADGTSMEVFTKEFNMLYKGKDEIKPLKLQYKDFAVWQRERLNSSEMEQKKAFWLNYLGKEIPLLNFPTDFKRPPVKNFEGDRIYFAFDSTLTQQVTEFSKSTQTTLFMFFLSAWSVFIARYANQEDVVIGVPVSGRSRPEIEETIGMFVNMLPMRNQPHFKKNFGQFLEEVKKHTLNAFANQDYQFDDLVQSLNLKRDLSRNAVFDVCFDFQNMEFHDFKATGLSFTPHQFETKNATYDLLLTLQENKAKGAIEGFIDYSTSLFKRSTLLRMIENFKALVRDVIADKNRLIQEIDIVSEEEKLLLEKFNSTHLSIKQDCMASLFQKVAEQFPDKVALIVSSGKTLTYRELNEKANKLALVLIELNLEDEAVVGIAAPRDEALFFALLGVLKAGLAYLLIDPSLPAERIDYMLTKAKAKVLLYKKEQGHFGFEGVTLDLDYVISNDKGERPANPEINHLAFDRLACVTFTSGSTGNPKGVLVKQSSMVNFIHDIKRRRIFKEAQDRVISVTTVTFDIFGFESIVPLCLGQSVYLAAEAEQLDPALVSQRILDYKVTHIVSTVSRIKVFVQNKAFEKALKQLKCIISGGERFPETLLESLKEQSHAQIYNMYGPTETTIWSTTKHLNDGEVVTIGQPIANTKIYIVNEALKLQPIGVLGELCIEGLGLARGYLGDADQQENASFTEAPSVSPYCIYKTGDKARFLENGDLMLEGRLDNQIKVRGYRIEPSEIEEAALKHGAIAHVGVVNFEDSHQNQQLALYYTLHPNNNLEFDEIALKALLKEKLPHYMFPARFIKMDKLPTLINGKVDKNRLRELVKDQREEFFTPTSVSSLSDLEANLLGIWREVLGVNAIGVDDNFFDLGGNSLALIQVNNRLSQLLGKSVPLLTLFEHPTIVSLAKHLRLEHKTEWVSQASTQSDISHGVAVIGMSCRFPGAANIDEFWENIVSGKESITEFDIQTLLEQGMDKDLVCHPDYIKSKGFLEGVEYFDGPFFDYSQKEAQMMDPQIRLLHECTWSALENAGYYPEAGNGKIGLFAGSSSNILWVSQWIKDQHDLLNAFEAISLNEKDFQATRLSYKLNLKGPSYNVQTACSTSLVAIHQAVQSLLNKECEMAIAGGVSISYPRKEGYLWHEGMIFSKDGHCRPFSEDASGIISGNGCGLVLLKPLKKALEDRDHIYAVIKGTAINNDGKDKVGYTAPSIAGQKAVIQSALKQSGVAPESISYVEAHGTGTKIGDPIEVEALKRAWETSEKAFCSLGSVKANVGHLDAAAGVASFIKTALVLYHRTLPPLVNFKAPNPFIQLDDSPFYIHTTPKVIPEDEKVLRAAVSSFGIGGTNAHVILEQAPFSEKLKESDTSKSAYLLPFSAKTSAALLAISKKIVRYFEAHPSANLADTAWTLQKGRKAFCYRKIWVITGDLKKDLNDASDFLSDPGHRVKELNAETKQALEKQFHHLVANREQIEQIEYLRQLGKLWCEGFDFDWELLWQDTPNKPYFLPLPTYAFDKIYYKNDILLAKTVTASNSKEKAAALSDSLDRDEKIAEKLSMIWQEMFGCKTIDPQDDFFVLGGDSLKAVVLSANIKKSLLTEISIEEIFSHSAFDKMVTFLSSRSKLKQERIPLLGKQNNYPVSSAQKRLYFVHQLLDDTLPYNLASVHWVEGVINHERLKRAVDTLIARHESFRTRFFMAQGEIVQAIEEVIKDVLTWDHATLENIHDKVRDAIMPFDLSKAPLIRIKLITIKDEQHVLVIDMHHIIADQTSIAIFVKELAELYEGKTLSPLPIQYKEFAHWQNTRIKTGIFDKQIQYWKTLFETPCPKLELPTDFPRQAMQTFKGGVVSLPVSASLSQAIDQCATLHGLTPYMVFIAGLKLTLWKYTGQKELVVGTGIAGRQHADVENVIGMFVNTLAIRTSVDEHLTVEEYFQFIKQSLLHAYENQDCQFEQLVETLELEKNLSRNPLFDVVINYINVGSSDLHLESLSIKPYEREDTYAKFDMTWTIEKQPQGYDTDIEYDCSLFKKETIAAFAKHLIFILSQLLENPCLRLNKIAWLNSEEKREVLYERNQNQTDCPRDKTVIALFEEQVKDHGDHIALLYKEESTTYHQLNHTAHRIAHILEKAQIKSRAPVALLLDRCPLQIACILGILKWGGIYVPIDVSYPTERIDFILEDSQAQAVLTSSQFLKAVPVSTIKPIILDKEMKAVEGELTHPSHFSLLPDDKAYILYTSGSTGKPKGVLGTHQNLIYVTKKSKFVTVHPTDRLLQISNYVFDGSLFDIFGALLNGASLVLPEKETIIDMEQLSQLIIDKGITLFYIPTALFNKLVDWDLSCLRQVRKIIFGGEAASFTHVKKAFDYLGAGRLINGYGPTETTFFATYYSVDRLFPDLKSVPIGYPMSNATLYILDQQLEPVPDGMVGELYIGGLGVTQGYLNRDKLTKEKFLDHPFEKNGKLYRTGDFVKRLPSGEIIYIQRIDNQIKIYGYRVELSEIEYAIKSIPTIHNAVVVAKKDKHQDAFLVAYYSTASNGEPSDLRLALMDKLPNYMIPAYFKKVEHFPLTPNGKIDIKALSHLEHDSEKEKRFDSDHEAASLLLNAMKNVLDSDTLTEKDNFFHRGGNSIKAIAWVHELSQKGIPLSVSDIFKYPTIEQLLQLPHLMKSKSITQSLDNVMMRITLNDKQIDWLSQQMACAVHWLSDVISTEKIAHTFPLSPIQMLFNEKKSLSGFTSCISGSVDEIKIRKIFAKIIQNNQLLHAKRKGLKSTVWDVYSITDPVIPLIEKAITYFDLSLYCDDTQKQLVKNLSQEVLAQPYQAGKLHFRLGCLKLNPNEHLILFGADHIIFDAMSVEIIRRQIQEGILNREKLNLSPSFNTYEHYVAQLEEGPKRIREREIIDQFYLKRWAKAKQLFSKALYEMPLSEEKEITLEIALEDIKTPDVLSWAFNFVVSLLRAYMKLDEIPLALVHYGRTYGGVDYYDCVGEFIDFIPFLVRKEERDPQRLMSKLIEICQTHIVNFMNFIWNPKVTAQFPLIYRLLTDPIKANTFCYEWVLFNFQGYVPEQEKKRFEEAIKETSQKALSLFSITVNYNETHLVVTIESEQGLNRDKMQSFVKACQQYAHHKVSIEEIEYA